MHQFVDAAGKRFVAAVADVISDLWGCTACQLHGLGCGERGVSARGAKLQCPAKTNVGVHVGVGWEIVACGLLAHCGDGVECGSGSFVRLILS